MKTIIPVIPCYFRTIKLYLVLTVRPLVAEMTYWPFKVITEKLFLFSGQKCTIPHIHHSAHWNNTVLIGTGQNRKERRESFTHSCFKKQQQCEQPSRPSDRLSAEWLPSAVVHLESLWQSFCCWSRSVQQSLLLLLMLSCCLSQVRFNGRSLGSQFPLVINPRRPCSTGAVIRSLTLTSQVLIHTQTHRRRVIHCHSRVMSFPVFRLCVMSRLRSVNECVSGDMMRILMSIWHLQVSEWYTLWIQYLI